jgi:hypothetical protein
MHRLRRVLIAGLCALALDLGPSAAQAGVVFQDNFNSENGGAGALNYFGFANWTVTNGSVDLIGNGFFDFYPGNGLYVDLDGSTGQAGTMQTNMVFAPGTYIVTFDLGGSQRGDTNTVNFSLGSFFDVFVELSADPLTPKTETVTLTSPSALSFQNLGGDNIGAILDNVTVTLVPEPASLTLLGIATTGIVGYGWRRRLLAVP